MEFQTFFMEIKKHDMTCHVIYFQVIDIFVTMNKKNYFKLLLKIVYLGGPTAPWTLDEELNGFNSR